MTLTDRLAGHALAQHPDQAANVLERLAEEEILALLERGEVAPSAAALQRLSPQLGSSILQALDAERAGRLLEALPVAVATRLLRRVEPARQASLLEGLEARRAQSIRSSLRFREGSAGALMDPDVLALPVGLSAEVALQRIRGAPELARYNLYVVDTEQRLVGALTLRELLLAEGSASLGELMVRNPLHLLASADRASVMTHPGWRKVHALPVVDEDGAFVGAVRYRVLRQLEEQLLAQGRTDADTGLALGQLIAAGARGILDSISSPSEARRDDGR